jgi:hypothetical protein
MLHTGKRRPPVRMLRSWYWGPLFTAVEHFEAALVPVFLGSVGS